MIRKRRHIRFIENQIQDITMDIVNSALRASRDGWTEQDQAGQTAKAQLIRKRHRRLRWVKW